MVKVQNYLQPYLKKWFCRSLSVVILICYVFLAKADDDQIWRNEIYDGNVHTVLFNKKGVKNSVPVLKLGGNTKLQLSFDYMGNETQDFQYTIQHCTVNWRTSDLNAGQYIEGINNAFVKQYEHSINTYKSYVHYSLPVPTRNMQPKMSGNYILKVYKNGNKDNLVLTRRFFVLDEKVETNGEVKQATYAEYQDSKHEVDFNVNYQNLDNVSDPFREIQVVVRQNERWDNAIYGLKPSYVQGEKLIYDHDEKNLFNAGNEFRPMDLRSVKVPRRGINHIELDSFYRAHLSVDESRSYKSHLSYDDINGSRIMALKGENKPHVKGDYLEANFYLKGDINLGENQAIYVFGGLSDWQIRDRFKMGYDEEEGIYYTSALIKQGYYDYKYVVASPYGSEINARKIEGSHFETENDYTVFVYFLSPFQKIYKLVGMKRLNSGIEGNN